MYDLKNKKCVPCERGTPPLTREEIEDFQKQLKLDWEIVENLKIKHDFRFKNFKEAISFVNKVADTAEKEQHHPNIKIFYNKVIIELSTYAILGLSENDFILASKIEIL